MTTETNPPNRFGNASKIIIYTIASILILASAIFAYLFFVHVTNAGLTFTNPLQVPALLESTEQDGQKIFELVPHQGETEFFAGQMSGTMGFNGSYLGPTMRFSKGDDVVINVTNQLDTATAVHWHGMHVPAEMDGTPHQMIPPGKTWQAKYPILNEAATMWYHPHPHGDTAEQVSAGLAGLIIIDDENSNSLNLPKTYGVDDIPLIVQDRLFDDEGGMIYQINNGSYYGNTMLVNGTVNPFIEVPAKQIRLRILNGSNGRIYNFGFDDNRTFHQIATDGGLLEAPVPLTRLKLATGERAEIVVDVSDGNEVIFKSYPQIDWQAVGQYFATNGGRHSHFDLLKIVPNLKHPDSSDLLIETLPQTLNTIERWSAADADNVRSFRLAGGLTDNAVATGLGPAFPINGSRMDMGRIDEVVMLNDVEIWEITNAGGQPHPLHIHDIQFLILDRNGVPPSPSESGWKDTVLINNGETVRFITQFTTYSNATIPYMYHCHILEHEDGGMMGQFVVADPAAELNQTQSLASMGQEVAALPLLPDNFFLQAAPYSCDTANSSQLPSTE
ncbi:MAG: multicopper oxidase family protein [Anaerolineae bacterium]